MNARKLATYKAVSVCLSAYFPHHVKNSATLALIETEFAWSESCVFWDHKVYFYKSKCASIWSSTRVHKRHGCMSCIQFLLCTMWSEDVKMNLHVIVARVNSVLMCIASYKASYVGAIANMKIVLQLATGVAIKLYSWLVCIWRFYIILRCM